jgi:hypothetical protein
MIQLATTMMGAWTTELANTVQLFEKASRGYKMHGGPATPLH